MKTMIIATLSLLMMSLAHAQEAIQAGPAAGTATQEGAEDLRKGDEALGKADWAEAAEHYRKAAELGNAQAMYRLGYMYHKDWMVSGYSSSEVLERTLNFEKSQRKRVQAAYDWYKKAADQGHVEAMHGIGLLFSEDEIGIETNSDEARKWFQRALDNGHEASKAELEKLR